MGRRRAASPLARGQHLYQPFEPSPLTSTTNTIAQPGGDFYGIANGLNGRAIIFAGGRRLEADGQVIGAVGSERRQRRQDEDEAPAA